MGWGNSSPPLILLNHSCYYWFVPGSLRKYFVIILFCLWNQSDLCQRAHISKINLLQEGIPALCYKGPCFLLCPSSCSIQTMQWEGKRGHQRCHHCLIQASTMLQVWNLAFGQQLKRIPIMFKFGVLLMLNEDNAFYSFNLL